MSENTDNNYYLPSSGRNSSSGSMSDEIELETQIQEVKDNPIFSPVTKRAMIDGLKAEYAQIKSKKKPIQNVSDTTVLNRFNQKIQNLQSIQELKQGLNLGPVSQIKPQKPKVDIKQAIAKLQHPKPRTPSPKYPAPPVPGIPYRPPQPFIQTQKPVQHPRQLPYIQTQKPVQQNVRFDNQQKFPRRELPEIPSEIPEKTEKRKTRTPKNEKHLNFNRKKQFQNVIFDTEHDCEECGLKLPKRLKNPLPLEEYQFVPFGKETLFLMNPKNPRVPVEPKVPTQLNFEFYYFYKELLKDPKKFYTVPGADDFYVGTYIVNDNPLFIKFYPPNYGAGNTNLLFQLQKIAVNSAIKKGIHTILSYMQKPSEQIIQYAVARDPRQILGLEKPSVQAQLIAVQITPEIIAAIKTPSPAAQLLAVKFNGNLIENIKNPANESVIKHAIMSSPLSIRFIDKKLITTEIAKLALRLDSRTITFIPQTSENIKYFLNHLTDAKEIERIINPTQHTQKMIVYKDPRYIVYLRAPTEQTILMALKLASQKGVKLDLGAINKIRYNIKKFFINIPSKPSYRSSD